MGALHVRRPRCWRRSKLAGLDAPEEPSILHLDGDQPQVGGPIFEAAAEIRDGGVSAVDQTLRPTGGGYENANYTVTMLPGAPTPGFTGRYRLAQK